MACHKDKGSGSSRPGRHDMWHKSSWMKSPLMSCQADDPQTGEQLYQRCSCTVAKVLGSTTDFAIWGSGKGNQNPQGWGQWDVTTELSQDWGNRLLEGTAKNCVHQSPGERSRDSREAELGLPVSVLGSPTRCAQQWPATGSGAPITTVLGAEVCCCKSF